MKSLKKFLKGLKGKIDPDEIENYYGHGTLKHDNPVHSQNIDNESQTDIKYKCPMKCEGNKTYDAPGHCPVCNMNLIAVDGNNQNTKDHQNPHHEEHHNGH